MRVIITIIYIMQTIPTKITLPLFFKNINLMFKIPKTIRPNEFTKIKDHLKFLKFQQFVHRAYFEMTLF